MANDIVRKILQDAIVQPDNMSVEPQADQPKFPDFNKPTEKPATNLAPEENTISKNWDDSQLGSWYNANNDTRDYKQRLADLRANSLKQTNPEQYAEENSFDKNDSFRFYEPNKAYDFLARLVPDNASINTPYKPEAQPETKMAEAAPALPSTTERSPAATSTFSGSITGKPTKPPVSAKTQDQQAVPDANLRDVEFEQAQKAAQENRERAYYNMLAGQLGNAVAGMGGVDLKDNIVESLKKQQETAGQPLTDLEAKRKQYAEFLKNKEEKEKNDPNSSVSKSMRDALRDMGVKIADNATYGTMEKQFPILVKNKEFQLKMQELHQKNIELAQNKEALRQNKITDQQSKVAQKVGQELEQTRGTIAKQAEADIYAANKFKSLFNLHGDPNKLNPQMVQLAATEIAKIASGGVPSIHELRGLDRSTIPSKLAELAESFNNKVMPAKKGEFLKEYKSYVDSLEKDAQKVITDKYGRILETHKKQMAPDDYENFKHHYVNRFMSAPQEVSSSGVSSELSDYAKEHFGGNIEAAKKFLDSKGVKY